MVERFLRYSLEHGRKITLMVADERGIRRMNVTVTAMDESTVTYTAGRAGKPKTLARDSILSAAYARGDETKHWRMRRMEKIKAILHDRDKLREAFLYLLFGVLTTLVSWGVYYIWRQAFGLTHYATDSAQYALITNSGQVVAFVLSVIFAFVTNKRLVFRSDKKGSGLWKEIGLFFSARVLGWVIFDIALFNLCLALLKNTLADADLWVKLLMNVLVVIFNYLASKFVIFRK